MNIIFGSDQAELLETKYTVLELDTIRFGESGSEVAVYCTIENIPISDLPKVSSMKTLHKSLIEHYRGREWQICLDVIEYLYGFWNNEVDTFYEEIKSRCNQYLQEDPGPTWNYVLQK